MNDGGWHEVKAQFNPSYMEVTVDNIKKSHRPENRDNRQIDLSGPLYFGGVQVTKRSRASAQGVNVASSGLRGCLSQLELDGRRIGLPEVLETASIESGCMWQYPCLSSPCIEGAACLQQSISGFKCECEHAPVCTKEAFLSNHIQGNSVLTNGKTVAVSFGSSRQSKLQPDQTTLVAEEFSD